MTDYHNRKKRFLAVGDVFQCSLFADGVYQTEFQDGKLVVLKERVLWGKRITQTRWQETERRDDGWERKVDRTTDIDAHDPGRGQARFTVISAHMGGGGTGHGPGDVYPDGWLVEAERLDGPREVVKLSQSGCFNDVIDAKDIEILEAHPPGSHHVRLEAVPESPLGVYAISGPVSEQSLSMLTKALGERHQDGALLVSLSSQGRLQAAMNEPEAQLADALFVLVGVLDVMDKHVRSNVFTEATQQVEDFDLPVGWSLAFERASRFMSGKTQRHDVEDINDWEAQALKRLAHGMTWSQVVRAIRLAKEEKP